jgi:hypothetical protein
VVEPIEKRIDVKGKGVDSREKATVVRQCDQSRTADWPTFRMRLSGIFFSVGGEADNCARAHFCRSN